MREAGLSWHLQRASKLNELAPYGCPLFTQAVGQNPGSAPYGNDKVRLYVVLEGHGIVHRSCLSHLVAFRQKR